MKKRHLFERPRRGPFFSFSLSLSKKLNVGAMYCLLGPRDSVAHGLCALRSALHHSPSRPFSHLIFSPTSFLSLCTHPPRSPSPRPYTAPKPRTPTTAAMASADSAPDDIEVEETPGYKAPAKVDLATMQNLDADDDALNRWKAKLLEGASTGGEASASAQRQRKGRGEGRGKATAARPRGGRFRADLREREQEERIPPCPVVH